LETLNRVTPRLVLYDLAGRRVRTLTDGKPTQGRREWCWDSRDQGGQAVASGMYFARLTGVGAPRLLRVVVIK
jgi:flagellar hook assembly protein FlgD